MKSPETMELLKACQEHNLDAIKTLLQKPNLIDFKATDAQGRSMLHLALGTGKVNANKPKRLNILAIVHLLCAHGTPVNAKDRSNLCPIHYCAQTIITESAMYLLDQGAKINASDANGRTALYYTAVDTYPDFEFVKMLVMKRARLGKAKPPQLPQRVDESRGKVRKLIDHTMARG